MNRLLPVLRVLAPLVLIVSGMSAASAQNNLPPAQPAQPPGGPAAAGAADDATYKQQISYMLGQNIGRDLKENEIDFDPQSFMAGVADALRGAQPRWSEAELQAAQARFQQEMQQKAARRMQAAAQKNLKEGQDFLAKNAQAPGVQTTPSGLQYKVLKQGNGPSPTIDDKVRCHYRGTLLDGTEFDSSYGGEPAHFPVSGVIPGWIEALQKMKVGDKWQLFIPGKLAYGAQPPPQSGIEPNSLLVFEVELLGIDGK